MFCLLPLSFFVFFQTPALALPQGQSVESGEASFQYSEDHNTLNVTAADKTVINFQSFNIASWEAVNFLQPSSSASVLARVFGGGPSVIAGSLTANGSLFLVNTAGINFSSTARVNVNNLVASSLDIATNNFLAGNYVFERAPGAPYAEVSNDGTLIGNSIALMGSRVRNSGLIRARVGKLHLASGDKTTVSFDSKGLINVEVNTETGSGDTAQDQVIADAAIANSGTLEGKSVILDAQVARNLFKSAVNQTGIIRSTAMTEENGVIRITANRDVKVSGNLDAIYGEVQVTSGENVEIPAPLQVSGNTTIKAEKDIAIQAAVTHAAGDMTFVAGRDIAIQADVTNASGTMKFLADRDIAIQAAVNNAAGDMEFKAGRDIAIQADVTNAAGTLKFLADRDIAVQADVINVAGDLMLIADNDLDGVGSYHQDAATTVSTVESGNITIQSSGESTLGNVKSSGDFTLRQGGAPANFVQQTDSKIITKGSMVIGAGVTLNAGNARYEVWKNWANYGNFIPQQSVVSLVSSLDAFVIGSNHFNDLVITSFVDPSSFGPNDVVQENQAQQHGKMVKFGADETQTITGTLTLQGEYGKLLVLDSTEPLKQWKILPEGETHIMYTLIGNSANIRGPPLQSNTSSSLGNNLNWDLSTSWTGSGFSANWSDSNNWNTGTVPLPTSTVVFNGLTGLFSNKDSLVDAAFQGSIESLILNGYTGTLTLGRDLALSADFDHKTGSFDPSTYGVEFKDASKPSHIYGNNTFYNFSFSHKNITAV